MHHVPVTKLQHDSKLPETLDSFSAGLVNSISSAPQQEFHSIGCSAKP